MPVTVGEIVPLVVLTRNSSGALETDTTVRITVTFPDGTASGLLTPTESPTGTHKYLYTTTAVGRHTWDATTASHAGFPGDVIDVQPASPIGLLSLADARAALNFGAGTVNDTELRGYIDAATAVVENIVGAVVPRTVVEVLTGDTILYLKQWPVLSLTSMVPYIASTGGITYLTAALLIDENGAVRLTSGWSLPYNTYLVTYKAGRLEIPPAVSLAAKIIVQHMWDTQRGGGNLPLADDGTPIGMGFLVPRRAAELLDQYTPLVIV